MTKKFDLFTEGLLSSFTELPEEVPYGFWITPNGKIYTVDYMKHNSVAIDIIKQFEPHLDDIFERGSIKNRGDFLISMNYLRLNISSDTCYVDCTYYPDSSNVIKRIKPTSKAKKTVEDIAMFYDIPVVFIYE